MAARLTVACGLTDRTLALFRREASIEGCDTTFVDLSAEEGFFRAFSNREFDVAELSFGSYLVSLAAGTNDYLALPVFPGRSFRHSAVYVRDDHIESPEELKGCRIGVPEYQMTAAIWVRGILDEDHGIAAEDVEWVTGGLHMAGRREKVEQNVGGHIRITSAGEGKTLSAMLADGDIDALISPRTPDCFANGAAHVARLFPDFVNVEADYFERTGIFPIMHVLGIRRDRLAEDRWLARSICKAFEHARRLAAGHLQETTSFVVMLPWLTAELERTKRIMGDDYWPYGVARNRRALEALCRFADKQGVLARPLALEELFAAGTYEDLKI